MMRPFKDMALALQFMTRLPIRFESLNPSDLERAAAWFPLVGVLIGGLASLLYRIFTPHVQRPLCALLVVLFLVLVTGGLHEDGLADCADAFGGGWTREDRLRIMKDSRIGSFGGIALIFSLGSRVLLLASIPASQTAAYLISGQVLSRWTPLPLSAALPSARGLEGQGGRLAGRTTGLTVIIGTLIPVAVLWYLLRTAAWQPGVVALAVTLLSGAYYQRRIGGITGDCMGATIQITEIAVYFCGVWNK
jgi:adenosylcobinamide-GDP ribazoletransferase